MGPVRQRRRRRRQRADAGRAEEAAGDRQGPGDSRQHRARYSARRADEGGLDPDDDRHARRQAESRRRRGELSRLQQVPEHDCRAVIRRAALALRVLLGAVFIYAAYTKLRQSWLLFALSIDSYQLLPEWAVFALARTLPWLELALGVLLI